MMRAGRTSAGNTCEHGSRLNAVQVYTITDRGPNQNCGDLADMRSGVKVDSGKGFPLENFAPSVTEIELGKVRLACCAPVCS